MNVVFFGFKEEGLAFINEEQARLLSNAEVRGGDVLLNITGASIGRVTTAPIWTEGARVNQHVCIIRPAEGVDNRFLSAYLSSPEIQSYILDENYGVTRQALTKQQILELVVPVPSLNEQRRIAAKLDTTLAAVEACRQRLDDVAAILKRFRQSVLAAATSGELTREWRDINQPSHVLLQRSKSAEASFSDNPFWELPSSWSICRSADVVESGADIVYGIVQPGPKLNEGVPYIRGTDIANGNILENQLLRTSEVIATRYKRSELQGGDVLLGIIRATKVAIVPDSLAGANITQGTARFRPSSRVRTKFLAIVLESPLVQKWLHAHYRGIDMPGLNLADVRRVPIPLPTLLEQDEVISRFNLLTDFADQLEAKLTAARRIVDRLTPALLAKAFRGELVPQDPSDEPASMLLERIRAARQADAAAGKTSRRGRRKAAASPEQAPRPAAPAPPDLLAQLLQECGALSERALLAASELDPAGFRAQLALEQGMGAIRETAQDGQVLLEAVG
jgi:type I restriction enzyme S subunit